MHWAANLVALLALVLVVRSLLTNPNFQWDVVGHYFLSDSILLGLLRTLELTVVAMLIGIVLGTVVACMRISGVRLLSGLALAYIWFFRGTPLLVQLIFWYNLAALTPRLGLGIPFGPTLLSGDANQLITPFVAAILGLGLNEAAYMSEIVRAGIQTVDHGQHEAATALGMRPLRVLRRIILPQAMRAIVPPTGNQTINMLKATSLVSVTSMPELMYSSQIIYQTNFQTIPLLVVASIWYLIVTSVLTVGQAQLERRYSRGDRRQPPPSAWGRFVTRWRSGRLPLQEGRNDATAVGDHRPA